MPALSSTSLPHLLPYPLGGERSSDELVKRLLIKGNPVEFGSTAKPGRLERCEIDNSTAPKTDSDFIAREASILLEAAKDCELGDEYETKLYDRLQIFLARYQKQAVDALTDLLIGQPGNRFAVSKVLEAIGAIDSGATNTDRFWILQRGLCSSSSMVRYGAALGFGSLRDSRAVPLLERVAEHEPNSEIKTVLWRVIAFLKTSR